MICKKNRLYLLLAGSLLLSPILRAQDTAAPASDQGPSALSNPFVWTMILVIVLLLIVIKSLATVLLTAARNAWTQKTPAGKAPGAAIANGNSFVEALSASVSDTPANPAAGGALPAPTQAGIILATAITGPIVNGLSDTAFYFIAAVIGLEILVILYLLFNVNTLLKKEALASAATAPHARPARPAFRFNQWWSKVNEFRPIEQEADLDMGHDYDGIRELDNKLPPWWKYGFYITMVFAVVYLWRYHVSHSAPLPAEEYQIAVKQAAADQAAYLKHAANSVDETTVKLLTDPADLAAGKAVFQTICFACHGMNGEGSVGPNLTDKYWLHGGSIQDIFKTVKYGYPDKGMKSWKDDYSPLQLAQISSYVKSLGGTNPPNPKPPQGTLVNE